MRSILFTLICVVLATPALAVDGVLEINQTCAVQTGCFPGDAAGFPVTMATSGTSYHLTSPLVLPNENTDGITFASATVANVSIDLGGFEIRGPVVCSGANPIVCIPGSGTGAAIKAGLNVNPGISFKNGSVTGMGSHAIFLGTQAHVANLRVSSNGGNGILAGDGSLVTDNVIYKNRFHGMTTGAGVTISRNSSSQNGQSGISTSVGSTISGNTAFSNGADGIFADGGSTAHGNTVRGNSGFGLALNTQSAYTDNTVSGNAGGTVSGGPVNMDGNACNGKTTCP